MTRLRQFGLGSSWVLAGMAVLLAVALAELADRGQTSMRASKALATRAASPIENVTAIASRTAPPRILTYQQAKAAGWPVGELPSQTGYRVCTKADDHGGFKSAAELEASLAARNAKYGVEGIAPGDCQEDPRTELYIQLPSGRWAGGLSVSK